MNNARRDDFVMPPRSDCTGCVMLMLRDASISTWVTLKHEYFDALPFEV